MHQKSDRWRLQTSGSVITLRETSLSLSQCTGECLMKTLQCNRHYHVYYKSYHVLSDYFYLGFPHSQREMDKIELSFYAYRQLRNEFMKMLVCTCLNLLFPPNLLNKRLTSRAELPCRRTSSSEHGEL